MSDESLAEKINVETPWWAKALDPKSAVYLAAGIVGVPSIMAVAGLWFIAGTVTKHLTQIRDTNVAEMSKLDTILVNQHQYWEIVRRNLAMGVEIQLRTCIHQATDQKERDDCMKGISGITKP